MDETGGIQRGTKKHDVRIEGRKMEYLEVVVMYGVTTLR